MAPKPCLKIVMFLPLIFDGVSCLVQWFAIFREKNQFVSRNSALQCITAFYKQFVWNYFFVNVDFAILP